MYTTYSTGHAAEQGHDQPEKPPSRPDETYVRAAVAAAAPNALRLSLYQITGDPDLATMKVQKQNIRGGALFDYVISEEDAEVVKEKAIKYLLENSQQVPLPPSISEARKLMNLFGGVQIQDNDVLPGYEELAFEDFPRGVHWSTNEAPLSAARFKVVVVGAGLSGLATAIQLENLGIPYTVIERQADLGGTWLLNSYPGCRVDTLSFLFQYKFEKRYKWKDYFAAREDTQEYLHHVARKYGVENKIQYNREVVAADWNEDSATWKLRINNKREQRTEFLDANAIISASGLFATAEEKPDIPGLEKFRGHMFHTTNWDHSVDETGLRVALIGTGSTGTQLAPLVAAKAKQLTVFQRNPNWIASYEGYDASVSDHATWLFDNMPYYWNWYCYAAYFRSLDLAPLQVRDLEYEATGGCVNERNDKIRDALTKFVHTKMAKRPDLIEKLIPKIPPLVRRLVVDNGFYETLMEPHVDLVTEGIQEINETGIIDRTGKHREFDLIVLAAGFKTSKYFFPCEYTGRNGAKLEDIFSKDGARSYLGMTMPGFPNLFTLYGPNHQPRGGSLYSWAEIWCRYAVSAVVWMIENNAQDIEVKRDVFDAYQDRLDAENKKLIWEWKGASYYVNEHGRQAVNMPWTTSDYHAMVIKPNMDDFNVRSRPLVNGVFLKLG